MECPGKALVPKYGKQLAEYARTESSNNTRTLGPGSASIRENASSSGDLYFEKNALLLGSEAAIVDCRGN
jgi:hypothetical protein